MSIVAYYARLSAEQLIDCAISPDSLSSGSVDHLPGAAVIDIDRSWEPMAWLISSCKREEHKHNALVMKDLIAKQRAPKQSLVSRLVGMFNGTHKSPQVSVEVRESLKRIDDTLPDLPLVAIEGRTEVRDERFDFGMGAAAVFPPAEVLKLHEALSAITITKLEHQYAPDEMERLDVFPGHWIEEGREIMSQYVLANFVRLQSFYASAAKNHQTVVMWYA